MNAIPNPAESEFPKGPLPVQRQLPAKRQLVEKVTFDPADLKNDQSQSEAPRSSKRIPLALGTITFCIGVVATMAWQSYGDAARRTIASTTAS